MTEYDLIVIGAGAVGENVADRAAQGGLTTVIVEQELVGGSCSYWACMPSKALLRSAAALRAAENVDGAKQSITRGLDVSAVFRRRDEFTHHWDDASQVQWLADSGIDLVRGHAVLGGPKRVTVTGADGAASDLTARHAVAICTGSVSALPDIPGLKEATPWTSRDATSAKRAPDRLAILGGGIVGVEMATAYAGFGTKVTLISRGPLLDRYEDFVSAGVTDALRGLGVRVLVQSAATRVHRVGETVMLDLADGSTVVANEVLVAVGRQPRTMELGLENIGVKPGDWLDVDDTMRVTGFDWLYAAGDVNHRAMLTHQGKYQARAAGDVIAARARGTAVDDRPWGQHVATADHDVVPQVVFTDPEVASVGLTAEQARKQGHDIRVIDCDLAVLAGTSLQADGYGGHARMIVDENRKVLLGMTLVGQDVSEMLQAATVAIVGEVPIDRLWHAVPAYPTMSEVWLKLLEGYGR